MATIDKRMFIEVPGGLWVSHRTYKTASGARALIAKLAKRGVLPYTVVETREYSYRPVDVPGTGAVYRVAVKTADLG